MAAALVIAAPRLLPEDKRTTVKVPANIDATGKTDVTIGLNNFFRSVRSGSTVAFPEKARYKAEGTVLIDAKRDVVVDGNYAVIFADTDGATAARPDGNIWWQPPGWPLNRAHLEMYRSSDLVVKHLRIRGPNPGGPGTYNPRTEGQSGISVDGCRRCEVEGNVISHTFGDGVEVNRGTDNLTVAHNDVFLTGRQGMTALNSAHIRFAENTLHEIGRTVFDLEPERGGFLRQVEIADNVVNGPIGGIFAAATGAGGTDDIVIQRNKLTGVSLIVRDYNSDNVSRRRGVAVVDNTTTYGFDNYPIGMITFGHIDGVEVKNNRAVAKPDEAVRCGDCTSMVVSGNSWQK